MKRGLVGFEIFYVPNIFFRNKSKNVLYSLICVADTFTLHAQVKQENYQNKKIQDHTLNTFFDSSLIMFRS